MTLLTSAFRKKGSRGQQRSPKVNKGHHGCMVKIPKIGQISKLLKVGKWYIKMTLLTSAFQTKGPQGQQRSPEVKNSENRSNFKSH